MNRVFVPALGFAAVVATIFTGGRDAAATPHANVPPVELVGEVRVGGTNAVAVDGDTAYVGVGPRLVILDFGSGQLVHLGATEVFTNAVSDVAVIGSTAFVAVGPAGLHLVDVSRPDKPVEVGVFD